MPATKINPAFFLAIANRKYRVILKTGQKAQDLFFTFTDPSLISCMHFRQILFSKNLGQITLIYHGKSSIFKSKKEIDDL